MRSWDTYVSLEATVKNMLTSLRAVGELQNPAIRERHWRQLMNSTKVSPEIAERTLDSLPRYAQIRAGTLHPDFTDADNSPIIR